MQEQIITVIFEIKVDVAGWAKASGDIPAEQVIQDAMGDYFAGRDLAQGQSFATQVRSSALEGEL